jgi:hypothetical protein
MGTLQERAAELATDDTDLGRKVARAVQATATWHQMIAMAHEAFAKQTLNNVGSLIMGRDRNAKFVKWGDIAMGSTAHFKVPKPGTFNDLPVIVSLFAGSKVGDYEAHVTVGRLPFQAVKRAGSKGPSQLSKELYEIIEDLLAKS